MKKWMVVAGLTTLLVCSVAMMSYAQEAAPAPHAGFAGKPGFGHGHGPGGFGFMLHELNLTDAQKTQVKELMKANRTTMKPLMQQMEQNHLAMLNATANGAYDAAKIQALAAQQAQLTAAMIVNHQAIQHQIYTQVLTSEQQAKAEQLRAQQVTKITERMQRIANGTEASTPPAQ
jgi:Spy/CpxP family protein refolding chaperone